MVIVIGKKNCSACAISKNLLDKKGIKYDYIDLDEISKELQEEYIIKARDFGIRGLPIVIKDDKITTLQEV